MARRTYVDANILISGFRGDQATAAAALAILGDPDRTFVISDYLRLETLPKPSFHRNQKEVEFLETFFGAAAEIVTSSPDLTARAIELATRYDLSPADERSAAEIPCDSTGAPKSIRASITRFAFVDSGSIRMSKSPVALGTPCAAIAWAPTTRNRAPTSSSAHSMSRKSSLNAGALTPSWKTSVGGERHARASRCADSRVWTCHSSPRRRG